MSSDADQVSGSEAEAEREEKQATAQLSASTAPAKIRPARQGMPASLWLQLLNVMQPSKVVLAGTVTFQAGLLYAPGDSHEVHHAARKSRQGHEIAPEASSGRARP